MTLDEKLDFLQEQLTCGKPVYTWQYDAQGQLLRSNCPDEPTLATAFSVFGCKEQMYEHARRSNAVVTLSAPIGLLWIADFERQEGEIKRAVVLGPMFATDVSMDGIMQALREYIRREQKEISLAWQQELLRTIERVPTLSIVLINQFAVLLHHAVTGEKAMFSDIVSYTDLEVRPGKGQKKDRHKVWLAEQGLMRMVREGDLNYRFARNNAAAVSTGVPVQSADPLRQAKTSTIVFISLCVRAAIEGGLSPEQAYSLGDTYIQSTESAHNVADISAINATMYEDFVHRVHSCRINPNISKQIRECCDYIEMNVEEKLDLSALAKQVGYTEYYLSRKFKEEVGVSINNYIKIAKIERAKLLLAAGEDNIQEISERLHFCTRSYFSEAFRKLVGCSPVEYRENYHRG